jgi:hypothetical protein
MGRLVPWRELCALIELFYPEAGERPPAKRVGTHAGEFEHNTREGLSRTGDALIVGCWALTTV